MRIALAPFRRSARDDRRVISGPQAEEQPNHGALVLCLQIRGAVGPILAHRSLHVLIPHHLHACLPELRPSIILRWNLARPCTIQAGLHRRRLVSTKHCHLVPQPSEAEDVIKRSRQASPAPLSR